MIAACWTCRWPGPSRGRQVADLQIFRTPKCNDSFLIFLACLFGTTVTWIPSMFFFSLFSTMIQTMIIFCTILWTPPRSLAVPTSWILWTDMDGADFFWTSGNCSTMVLPDSGIVGNNAPLPPSTGGISETWTGISQGKYGKLFQVFCFKVGRHYISTLANILFYSTDPFDVSPALLATTHSSLHERIIKSKGRRRSNCLDIVTASARSRS